MLPSPFLLSRIVLATLILVGVSTSIAIYMDKKRRASEGNISFAEFRELIVNMIVLRTENKRWMNRIFSVEKRTNERYNKIPIDEKAKLLFELYTHIGEEDKVRFECLNKLHYLPMTGENALPFWRENRSQIRQGLLKTIRNYELNADLRHEAMKIMSLMMEKGIFAETEFQDILAHMLIASDRKIQLAEWTQQFDEIEREISSDFWCNWPLFDIIRNSHVLKPFVLETSKQLLGDDDWERRSGGCRGLATLGKKHFSIEDSVILDVISNMVSALKDTHPRVRDEACYSLDKALQQDIFNIRGQCCQTVIPALVTTLNDSVTRVAAHAAAVLRYFVPKWASEPEKLQISSYFNSIMMALVEFVCSKCDNLISNGQIPILIEFIESICVFGKADPKILTPFYSNLIDPLKTIFKETITAGSKLPSSERLNRTTHIMCGLILECFSIMSVIADNERYKRDASEIMNDLISTLCTPLFASLLSRTAFFSHVGAIASGMGNEFGQFVPLLMNHLVDVICHQKKHTAQLCGCQRKGHKSSVKALIRQFSRDHKDEFTQWENEVKLDRGQRDILKRITQSIN